jgi:hypothetical protein
MLRRRVKTMDYKEGWSPRKEGEEDRRRIYQISIERRTSDRKTISSMTSYKRKEDTETSKNFSLDIIRKHDLDEPGLPRSKICVPARRLRAGRNLCLYLIEGNEYEGNEYNDGDGVG